MNKASNRTKNNLYGVHHKLVMLVGYALLSLSKISSLMKVLGLLKHKINIISKGLLKLMVIIKEVNIKMTYLQKI